jgi:8-oxo-dGTP pyrophosphatase MutT (NUDIX family)
LKADRPLPSLPLHGWADEIRSIANEELLNSNPDEYTRRRCERLIRIAAEIAALGDERDPTTVESLYRGDLVHRTPYCGGEAAIVDEAGRVLLIQRTDNQLWAMPGGAFEVGETPAEGTRREAWEETGIEVAVLELSGVYDSRYCGTRLPYHLYHFVFLCRPSDPDAIPCVSNGTLDVRWFTRDELPPMSPGHELRLADALRRRDGTLQDAIFDRLR